ncbi:class I SAM-dependent methyltransferase [Variovorax sp. 160MFSha2.1]|uniref:class I SAM-dependent methyltransferase n=1 Tax=Variovorax sp. 160MFSha2.1 TaxID=3158367 RepID=UPI003AAF6D6C
MAHIGESWLTFDSLTQHVIKAIGPRRILDIGAGGGKYGALLRDIVPECELTALECDEMAFPRLREVGYHQILPITADKLYERSGELYDVVILGDVIEHMLHSQGRDLLEFLNYRSRYLIISTPECMPMSRPIFFEGHNSLWRPDSFGWHDYWAHQQCGVMHFYLLRGHDNWAGPGLAEVVDAVNGAGLFNEHSSGRKEPVNLAIRDTRYKETSDGHNFVLYRPL